jgi:hypothetical protein
VKSAWAAIREFGAVEPLVPRFVGAGAAARVRLSGHLSHQTLYFAVFTGGGIR